MCTIMKQLDFFSFFPPWMILIAAGNIFDCVENLYYLLY